MAALTRRELLTSPALGLALAGCSGRPREQLVSIHRSGDYGQHLYGLLRQVLAAHRVDVRGKRVLLKPNLVEFEPGSPINTHPLFVHAALEAFRAEGAHVTIGEGPGHRRNTLDMAEAAGYFRTIPGFEDLFTDLNLDRPAAVRFAHPHSRLESIYLAQSALACDLLVTCPK